MNPSLAARRPVLPVGAGSPQSNAGVVGTTRGRTGDADGQVGEVGPAAPEQDGGVSLQAADRHAAGVLQGRRHPQRRHADRHTVTLVTGNTIRSGKSPARLYWPALTARPNNE